MEIRFPKVMGRKLDGIITEWYAEEGAHVEVQDRLFSYETSKMTSSVISPAAGTLHRLISAGNQVKYDQVVADIAEQS